MNGILRLSRELLESAGYQTKQVPAGTLEVLAFEGDTVIGFVLAWRTVEELLNTWSALSTAAISSNQFAFRRAGVKAWNTYLVLMCEQGADHAGLARLGSVEEDLSGTRKIARAGITSLSDVSAALLPLLPLQSAPRLDAIDVKKEIRERTTELNSRSVEAFLSEVEDGVVLQVLEQPS